MISPIPKTGTSVSLILNALDKQHDFNVKLSPNDIKSQRLVPATFRQFYVNGNIHVSSYPQRCTQQVATVNALAPTLLSYDSSYALDAVPPMLNHLYVGLQLSHCMTALIPRQNMPKFINPKLDRPRHQHRALHIMHAATIDNHTVWPIDMSAHGVSQKSSVGHTGKVHLRQIMTANLIGSRPEAKAKIYPYSSRKSSRGGSSVTISALQSSPSHLFSSHSHHQSSPLQRFSKIVAVMDTNGQINTDENPFWRRPYCYLKQVVRINKTFWPSQAADIKPTGERIIVNTINGENSNHRHSSGNIWSVVMRLFYLPGRMMQMRAVGSIHLAKCYVILSSCRNKISSYLGYLRAGCRASTALFKIWQDFLKLSYQQLCSSTYARFLLVLNRFARLFLRTLSRFALLLLTLLTWPTGKPCVLLTIFYYCTLRCVHVISKSRQLHPCFTYAVQSIKTSAVASFNTIKYAPINFSKACSTGAFHLRRCCSLRQ